MSVNAIVAEKKMFSASKFKRSTPRTGFGDLNVSGESTTSQSLVKTVGAGSSGGSGGSGSSGGASSSSGGGGGHRPNSAPTITDQAGQETISLVEQRLRIVKRHRATKDDTTVSAQVPPCRDFPAFDAEKKALSRAEQQALMSLVVEVADSVVFPDVIEL